MIKCMVIILTVFTFIVPVHLSAASFDGTAPLLCALMDGRECGPENGCQRVTVESINIPHFVRIDFDKKTITGTAETGRQTAIENMERIDRKVILQGAEDGIEGVRDGLGWTLAIMEDTGRMVVTASGDEVGFVIFGACTEL